jgi:hypothetical protein
MKYSLILNIPGQLAFSLPPIVCGIIGSTVSNTGLMQKRQQVFIYLFPAHNGELSGNHAKGVTPYERERLRLINFKGWQAPLLCGIENDLLPP